MTGKFILIFSGGGFNISPLKPQNGKPRTQVQHLMQIDLKGWGLGYVSSFRQYCLLQMLNSVAGIVWFLIFTCDKKLGWFLFCGITTVNDCDAYMSCHIGGAFFICHWFLKIQFPKIDTHYMLVE